MAVACEVEPEPVETGPPDTEGWDVDVGKILDIGGRALAREEDVGIVNRDVATLVEGVVSLDDDAPEPEPETELEADAICEGLVCLSEPTTPSAVRNSLAHEDAVGALYRAEEAYSIVPQVCAVLVLVLV